LPAVLHRRRRPAAVGNVRARPPARLRLGVPGRRRAGQRRVRAPPPARHLGPPDGRPVARPVATAGAAGAARRGRTRRPPSGLAAGLTPWTRRTFARWLFEAYPRALVLTPARGRRGALTGPGAYQAA